MKATSEPWYKSGILLSYVVFGFLMLFTIGLLFLVPYPGFYFNPTTGEVMEIYEDMTPASAPHLKVGDVLKSVGPISFEQYRQISSLNFFSNYQPGAVVDIVLERDGETITVPWVYAGFNNSEFETHFFNVWWLAYIFWIVGTCTQIFMRPKDKRWALFVAINYLTGMFIMLGSVSSFGFLGSPVLMRMIAWLMLPVYIHFHWIFPRSLRPVPGWVKYFFYVAGCVLALTQLHPGTPSSLYFVAIIFAFGGSILLLVAHYIFQPEYRREVSILAIAALISLGFTTVAGVIGVSGQLPSLFVLTLLALPILPFTYFYVLSRRSLGGLELRTNRAISLYAFLVLLGIVLMVIVGYFRISIAPEAFLFSTVLIALSATFIGVRVFPVFQSFVERRLLGIKLPAQNMIGDFSERIVASTTSSGLLNLLEEDVFPSLLIRQYAFVQIVGTSGKVVLARHVDRDTVQQAVSKNIAASAPPESWNSLSITEPHLNWTRVVLSLKIGDEWVGAWLLGRRDPDDYYPQMELPTLQSLANQTAIALSYIVQTERLKLMYEANIERYEQERLRLGRELHDSLLNEMAAMLMKHDPVDLPSGFQKSFDGLIVRLREIVTDLRPPMLIYGLKFALDGLADNLSERNQDTVQIVSNIQSDEECRYPDTVEHNLYRIVQEACENALKYAQARSIRIGGYLLPDGIEIQVMDDGVGFNHAILLDEMVANKHYGLAGMHERASLIGADIEIQSKPQEGTQIRVAWRSQALQAANLLSQSPGS